MTPMGPRQWHEQAVAAEKRGDADGAFTTITRGLEAHPDDAALHNSAGSLAMRTGKSAEAERLFARALELEPANNEFAINLAIALGALERHDEACAILSAHEPAGSGTERYWSVRANAERAARRMADAARSYDRCLALNPRHARGLHGRARVAIERAENDAQQRFDAALAVNPGEPDLWLGKAQALDVAGQSEAARQIMEQVVAQAPGWTEGLKFLAQIKLAAGERDFASHYREAAQKHAADPNIPYSHAEVLASVDRAAEAADIAAEARRRFPDLAQFGLLEAVHAGSAGDNARADAIFSRLDLDTSHRWIQEARHRIRQGEPQKADVLLERATALAPWDIGAWAMRGIAWRLLDDPRAAWLHEQDGLVQKLPLHADAGVLDRAVEFLGALHDRSPFPLGQSLRGGTQTRGNLFERPEPALADLHAAILATIEDYRANLPPADATHPLLRHAGTELKLAGSWSVRLKGGGDYHTAHIHPQGILSSALYCIVPNEAAGPEQRGWLEVGRPPPDLGLDLPPIRTLQPEPGYLALFPSTMYHGTTAFGDAERMTVAFDVVPVAGPRT